MAILPNFDDGQNEQNRNNAKILKRKKSCYYQNHTKSFSAHNQGKIAESEFFSLQNSTYCE